MKRRNVQEAFVGEPSGSSTGNVDNLVDGDDAVDFEVRSGKVMVVVPSSTPDDQVFEKHSFIGGEIELEDGRILSFQIEDGAVGAQIAIKAADEIDRGAGLSSIPDIPSGV